MEEYANLSLSFSSFPNHPLCRVLLYYFILVGPIGKTNAKTDNFLPEQMTSYPDFTMGGEGGFHNIGWASNRPWVVPVLDTACGVAESNLDKSNLIKKRLRIIICIIMTITALTSYFWMCNFGKLAEEFAVLFVSLRLSAHFPEYWHIFPTALLFISS